MPLERGEDLRRSDLNSMVSFLTDSICGVSVDDVLPSFSLLFVAGAFAASAVSVAAAALPALTGESVITRGILTTSKRPTDQQNCVLVRRRAATRINR